jgi:hypothetical protein
MKPGKKRKRLKTGRAPKRRARTIAPKRLQDFSSKPKVFQDEWVRMTHVVTRMRAGRVSLARASKEFGISSKKVSKLGSSAIRKGKNGKYVAKSRDTLLRILVVPASNGLIEIGVRDSRRATKVAKYWAAVQKYLETGNVIPLRAFEGAVIPIAGGGQFSLITDPVQLRVLGSAGVLSFETLYAKTA